MRERQKGRPLCTVGVSGGIRRAWGKHLSGKAFFPGCREAQRLGKSEGSLLPLSLLKLEWDRGLRTRRVDPSLSLSDGARFGPTISETERGA